MTAERMLAVYEAYRLDCAQQAYAAERKGLRGASWALGHEAHRARRIADALRSMCDEKSH
jgi:hypothetical protein